MYVFVYIIILKNHVTFMYIILTVYRWMDYGSLKINVLATDKTFSSEKKKIICVCVFVVFIYLFFYIQNKKQQH